jgi:uncharacterized delta-60 repeat protein
MNARGIVLASAILLSAGCQSILGIEDTSVGGNADAASGTDGASIDASVAASFTVETELTSYRSLQGGTVDVLIRVTRDSGYTSAIDLSMTNLPTGVTSTIANLDASTNEGTVTLTVDASAADGAVLVQALGEGIDGTDVQSIDTTLLVARPPGQLDTSFNGVGALTDIDGTQALDLELTELGRIYVLVSNANQTRILAYNQDGTRATEFNNNGFLQTDDQMRGIATIPGSNGIVAVGVEGAQMTILRFAANGAPDGSLNSTGQVTTTPSQFSSSSAHDAAVDSSGNIFVAGFNGSTMSGVVAAFDSGGMLRDSQTYSAVTGGGGLKDIDLQSDGSIIVGGTDNAGTPNWFTARLTYANNALTAAATRPYGNGPMVFQSLEVGPDDRVAIAGTLQTNTEGVGRIEADLIADVAQDFIQTGLSGYSGSGDSVEGVAVQADGRILVTAWGCWQSCMQSSTGVFRRLTTGAVDTTFGTNGDFFVLRHVEVQDDGRIVAAGEQNGVLWIVRLWD